MEVRSGALVALLGAFVGAGALLLMSQAFASSAPVRVRYVPDPADYVQIQPSGGFVVPPGRVFVPTALGMTQWLSSYGGVDVLLLFNGVPVVTADVISSTDKPTMVPLPEGLSAPAGTAIDVDDLQTPGTPPMRVWGYLYKP